MLNYRDMPGPGDFLPPEYSVDWKDPQDAIESAYFDILNGEAVTSGNGVMDFWQAIEPIADEIASHLFLIVNAKPRDRLAIANDLAGIVDAAVKKAAEEIF